ncbi:diguanylate cyclase [Mycoplasmatota bacterium]|nr:diguanylate cyclase [Mycoplasmatota bacterium]
MNNQTFIGIINNIALLFTILLVYSIIPLDRLKNKYLYKFFIGIGAGAVGLAVMSTPVIFGPGIVFDSRSILITMSGVFLGFIPTFITALFTSVHRLIQGGTGAITGVVVIFSSGILGLTYRYVRFNKGINGWIRRWVELYLLGLIVHSVMILWFFLMPYDVAMELIRSLGLIIIVVYPLGTTLLGVLFFQQHDKDEMAIKVKESERKLEYLSFHDPLTDLYNRRYYELILKELDQEKYYPLTIMMGDVNGLKLVNDSLGHDAGDQLILKVSRILNESCRENDIIARVGGDEFMILLPNTDIDVAESISKAIMEKSLDEYLDSTVISISVGCATKYLVKENIKMVIKDAEDKMYKTKLIDGPIVRKETIDAIINSLFKRDENSEAHSRRVSDICVQIGNKMELSESDLRDLRMMGMLHDIGKVAIPTRILKKQDSLSEDEWIEMRKHPEVGYRILSSVKDTSDILECVIAHHERWDGNGYPRGINGEKIPLLARILSIADAYDAMTSERPYRNKLSKEEAVSELKNNSGSQFDPNLVEIFINDVLHTIA